MNRQYYPQQQPQQLSQQQLYQQSLPQLPQQQQYQQSLPQPPQQQQYPQPLPQPPQRQQYQQSLPQPPQQQQHQQPQPQTATAVPKVSAPPPVRSPVGRQRKSSGFSFRSLSSSKSHKRGGSSSLTESPAEKSKNKMSVTTKANPNAAISEAQPIALALEKSTLISLQNIRCNDIHGNLITDPDKSNPTRWKMERPLETIRSFELAIDRGYATRQSTYGPSPGGATNGPNSAASPHPGYQSQRSSAYWGNQNGHQGSGYDPNGRFSNFSGNGEQGSRDSFHGNNNGYNQYSRSNPALNRYGSNGQGAPQQGGAVYAVGDGRSRDTLHTAGVSNDGSEESAGVHPGLPDQAQQQQSQYPARYGSQMAAGPMQSAPHLASGNYAYNNSTPAVPNSYFQSNPNLGGQQQQYASQQNLVQRVPAKQQQQQLAADGRPPAPPPKAGPIKLNNPNPPQAAQQQRTSWLKKRFSKSGK